MLLLFVLADSKPSYIQAANFDQPSVGCGFNVSSVFKAFAIQFGSVSCVSDPAASVGPAHRSISLFRSRNL